MKNRINKKNIYKVLNHYKNMKKEDKEGLQFWQINSQSNKFIKIISS